MDYIYLAVCAVLTFSVTGETRQGYIRQDPRFNDRISTVLSDLVFILYPASITHCSHECFWTNTCRGFFYYPLNISCTLYLHNMHDLVPSKSAPGMKYFEITGPVGDIAKGRPTHASAFVPGLPASLAVNGRRDPRQRPVYNGIECYHSLSSNNTQHWWYVDLQGSYVVTTVAILTRATCCAEEIRNIRVKVGLSLSSLQVCGITSSEIPARNGTMAHIKCPKPVSGRYVYLTKSVVLVLCTVEVYGRKALA